MKFGGKEFLNNCSFFLRLIKLELNITGEDSILLIDIMENKYNDLLILYNSRLDYFISCFEKRGIRTKRTYKKSSFLSRVLRRTFEALNFSQDFWYGDWKRDLSSFKTVIIFADSYFPVLKFIKGNNRDIRIIYWYWDPVFRLRLPKKIIFETAEIWSFDPSDCLKFGFKFNTTFYFSNIFLPKNTPEYDVIFVGNDKGRMEYLQKIRVRLTKLGIKGYYHVIPDRQEHEKKQRKEIPYVEYLKIVSRTRVLIDLIPFGQSGLTIRAMESIFFNKKLITNDPFIINQNFYTRENIFILGKDNGEKLRDFINSPYKQLDNKIVKSYDVSNWLKRFNI